jgi:hypothetical protein
MDIFTKTKVEELQFNNFIEGTNKVYERLSPYENLIDISEISRIKNNFSMKVEDFYREERKLNIGILGRVKSGKSSFLNTFLFEGKDILPYAVTPKTAVLTKMEYGDENSFDVEYIPGCEKKGVGHQTFESYEQLVNELDEYISESGTYTDSVESVSIHMKQEELRGISIADTPGFCDPVISRTKKTKSFLELCDVVFFLSKATGFLDKEDVELLTTYIPLKGVKKIVLLCSRTDDGLRDVLSSEPDLKTAFENMKKKLSIRGNETFNEYFNENNNLIENVMEDLKNPVFISSTASNMINKNAAQYSEKEKKLYEDLNLYKDLTIEDLKEIGNLDQVKTIFEEVINKKDDILLDKAMSFVSVGKEELRITVLKIANFVEKKISEIENIEKGKLLTNKRTISSQLNGMGGEIERIFGELNHVIEQNKGDTLRNLMGDSREFSQISEREGMETHYQVDSIATSKWFIPWTWGNSQKEVSSRDQKYSYIEISDALENISNFAEKAKADIWDSLSKAVDVTTLKNQLLKAVRENFDASEESYNTSYFKLVVERTLARIEIPSFSIETSNAVNQITQNFSGEIRSIAKTGELRSLLSRVSNDLFNDISQKYDQEARSLKESLLKIKQQFSTELLENLNYQVDSLMIQIGEKDKKIEKYNNLLDIVKQINVE